MIKKNFVGVSSMDVCFQLALDLRYGPKFTLERLYQFVKVPLPFA